MSIIRIANIFKRSLPPKLGRWRTDEPIDVIYRKVQLATDDHCGSDLCQKKVFLLKTYFRKMCSCFLFLKV